jgi:hypothetical protein
VLVGIYERKIDKTYYVAKLIAIKGVIKYDRATN